jgi:hypothetical protein
MMPLQRCHNVWSYDLAPHPHPPPSPVSKLDRRHPGRPRKKDNLLSTGEREGGGRGAKSNDRKKAWPFVNDSKLFGPIISLKSHSATHIQLDYFGKFSVTLVFIFFKVEKSRGWAEAYLSEVPLVEDSRQIFDFAASLLSKF